MKEFATWLLVYLWGIETFDNTLDWQVAKELLVYLWGIETDIIEQ